MFFSEILNLYRFEIFFIGFIKNSQIFSPTSLAQVFKPFLTVEG